MEYDKRSFNVLPTLSLMKTFVNNLKSIVKFNTIHFDNVITHIRSHDTMLSFYGFRYVIIIMFI